MMRMILAAAILLLAAAPQAASARPPAAAGVPAAVFTDPPADAAHPPRMEVLHIPSGGVKINGVAYLAGGAGAHPTVVLLHGLPGNEKNLDLAQAIRRAGWNVVTVNYRGSWGSPGAFSFEGNLADAKAVLAFVRDPANAGALQIDIRRLVLAGHSMGGWVTALTAAQDPGLAGAVLISAADMGGRGAAPAAKPLVVKAMSDQLESLAGTSPEKMADVQRRGGRGAGRQATAGADVRRRPGAGLGEAGEGDPGGRRQAGHPAPRGDRPQLERQADRAGGGGDRLAAGPELKPLIPAKAGTRMALPRRGP
jgi:pimeloyl-ACP methyl ester carboxylesterase